MDEIYGVFKGHVQAIRGAKLKKNLDDLAGGRVYTGRQALELGLVDKIGTLQDAVQHVAQQAGVSDYEIRVVPEPKSFIELLLEDSSSKADEPLAISVGQVFNLSRQADSLSHLLEGLDPRRVRTIQRSLLQLNTLRHEGAVLAMPEILWAQ